MNGRVFCHENTPRRRLYKQSPVKSKLDLQPDNNPGQGCGHDHAYDSETIDNHGDLRMLVIIIGIQASKKLLVLQLDDGPGNCACRQYSQNGECVDNHGFSPMCI